MRVEGKLMGDEEGVDIKDILINCPILKEKYIAPLLWGKNGHIQTATYGLLGHAELQRSFDQRVSVLLNDGTTVIYDIFEPRAINIKQKDVTLALCPGIANNSGQIISVHASTTPKTSGYRCAVLNHLGSLDNVTLTSSRIFCYGSTEETEAMMSDLVSRYPHTQFINIGFSMGANIMTKYLSGMCPEMVKKTIIGLSVGQGYSASKAAPYFHDWENGRRVYNYIINEKVKQILWKHYDKCVKPHVVSGLVDESKIWAASSCATLDEHYHRRVNLAKGGGKVEHFRTVEDFYEWCGSLKGIPSIKVPMVFLNAEDDPIVPIDLIKPVQEMCLANNKFAHVLTKHGGHLGFLEGRSLKPSSKTWLDRFIVQLSDAAVEAQT
uniref:AB hydrolase-1 domain-containing protein n=1 Tax=Rhabditophanes sp. KR3021 TaxID=114890 RepID=A0AC35UEM3_9BILA